MAVHRLPQDLLGLHSMMQIGPAKLRSALRTERWSELVAIQFDHLVAQAIDSLYAKRSASPMDRAKGAYNSIRAIPGYVTCQFLGRGCI
ncbi:hypothetical protein RSOLAG1IB_06625 [Rhizoctonia solani AG-1 IB]|uniref:Uncharacterized protein n=1 Tax=Thanatephorus cucumeris (strain AG1-IB / isolate 7/3/14) TaxID=1108050 RepID=A0A0B7FA85_THACB|nr:hypothetical protein RSOLAG1IB_06625 [Rhizoctonia solani AG-1 IB]